VYARHPPRALAPVCRERVAHRATGRNAVNDLLLSARHSDQEK
jgi:hypothetical protein